MVDIGGPDPTKVMGRRVAAYIVDGVLPTMLFLVVLRILLGDEMLTSAEGNQAISANSVVTQEITGAFAVGLVLLIIYYAATRVWLQGVYGWTPGKLFLGIRCVGWDGRPPGMLKSLIRTAVMFGFETVLSSIGTLILFGSTMVGPGNRGLHDRAAGTYVIDAYYFGRLIKRTDSRVVAGPASMHREEAEAILKASGVTPNLAPVNATKDGKPVFDKDLGTYVVWNVRQEQWLAYDEKAKTWHPLN